MPVKCFEDIKEGDMIFFHKVDENLGETIYLTVVKVIPECRKIIFDNETEIQYYGYEDKPVITDRYDKGVYTTISGFQDIIQFIYRIGYNDVSVKLQKFLNVYWP